jgi:hypothetical protein
MAVNFKNILKVYGLMRSFSADDTALLETLRGLTDPEREMLIECLMPEKPTRPRIRKTSNARAIAEKIAGTAAADTYCTYRVEDGDPCDEYASNAIHDPKAGYSGYHEFVAAKARPA